ncbi:MAG: UTP--glucose-1-phosphate uridylyltransferase [Chlamydia sp.]
MNSYTEREMAAKAAFFEKRESSSITEPGRYTPPTAITLFDNSADPISIPNLGFVILAGGQSTRMNIPSGFPKALLSITQIKRKSLIQLFFEKASSYEKLYQTKVHIAIFVSESTQEMLCSFLNEYHYFGIDKSRISLIQQPSIPLLDDDGGTICDDSGVIMRGPDGNGSLLYTMKKSGLLDSWSEIGIQYVTVGQIDNPLLNPFHIPLLQAVQRHNIVYTGVKKRDSHEKVGIFVNNNRTNKLEVQEYSERETLLSLIESPYTLDDFEYANISQCAFQMKWADTIYGLPLPWHRAKKESKGKKYYKMEQFLFDTLQYADSSALLHIERSLFFSPIKQQRGADSLHEAQENLQKKDLLIFQSLTQKKKIELPLELHPFWEYYNEKREGDQYELALKNGPSSGYISPTEMV